MAGFNIKERFDDIIVPVLASRQGLDPGLVDDSYHDALDAYLIHLECSGAEAVQDTMESGQLVIVYHPLLVLNF